MNDKTILQRLFQSADAGYAAFTSKLIPNISEELIIGVRAPVLRSLIKELGAEERASFLADLPHSFHEENMLHAYLLSGEKDGDSCLRLLEEFLPYVDNWAVCDSIRPAVLTKDPERFLAKIRGWLNSPHPYTCRFGLEMLMCYYLDSRFAPELCELAAAVRGGEYYVDMMLAWYFATALAKQWDAALPYLTEKRLSPWVHNKTIRKAIESYRISDSRKAFLRTLSLRKPPNG